MPRTERTLKCQICQQFIADHAELVPRNNLKSSRGTPYHQVVDWILDSLMGRPAVHRSCLKKLRSASPGTAELNPV